MSKKRYDEKQLIERGKSFQYAFIGGIAVNVIIYILSEFAGIGFNSDAVFLINIGFPIAIYMLSMIIKGCYDGISPASELLNITALCGCGVALFIIYLPDVISGKKHLMENAAITENASALLIGILTLVIVFVYLIKKVIEKREDEE